MMHGRRKKTKPDADKSLRETIRNNAKAPSWKLMSGNLGVGEKFAKAAVHFQFFAGRKVARKSA